MKSVWTGLFLALFIAVTTVVTIVVTTAPPAGGLAQKVGRKVGDMHPEIVLPSLDGKRNDALSQFRGKKVLLVQFASW